MDVITEAPDPQMTALAGREVDAEVVQRALGAMLGSAVGDALGAPFEFGPPGAYSHRFPIPLDDPPAEMVGGGGCAWRPGEFTDDTQMALIIARSLVTHGHYDPDHLWAEWRAWAATASDVGLTTRASLVFADWRAVRVADPGRTAGNGALMRAAPLAVAYHAAPDDVARHLVRHQAALTHQHPAAGWGAWLGVAMMRAGLSGQDAFAVLEREISVLPAEVADGFTGILHPDWTPDDPMPGNGSVWGCLAQAVWAVRHHDRFEDVLVAAINLGGDTDTVACVAGAIAGARSGVGEIPCRWLAPLHGSVDTTTGPVYLDAADLEALALGLLGVG